MGCRGTRTIPPRHLVALTLTVLCVISPPPFLTCVDLLCYDTPALSSLFCFFPPHRASHKVNILISSYPSTLLLTHFFLLLWLTRHVLSIPHYFCSGFSFPLHPADAGCSTAAVLIFIFFPPFLHIPFVLVHLYTVHSCPSYSIALRLHTPCTAQHAHTEDRGYFIHVLFCFSACLWYLWYDFMRNRCFR